MKRRYWIVCGLLAAALAFVYFQLSSGPAGSSFQPVNADDFARVKSSFSAGSEDAQSRSDFNLGRLRDPVTGTLPVQMRQRELAFVHRLNARTRKQANKLLSASWQFRGPVNVGGRTRAVDLDFNGSSNRRLLAGGVSGGIFISEDDGANWRLATSLAQFASVTSLVQDPNNRNVWYHGTGEFFNSVRGADFLGQGIFKSTDRGETWQQLPATAQGSSPNRFDNVFDFVWNLAISPQTGSLYAATIATIMKSTDGGASWQTLLAGQDAQGRLSLMTDVTVAANGTIYATLSRNGAALGALEFGVFRSDDDGASFGGISPPGLAPDPYRMVLAAAPSDPATLYLLVQTTPAGDKAADHQLFRYNATGNSWTDLSANIPNPDGPVGTFSSQGGYDLLVKVKPDNPNVIWIGGTNLHRSTNGGHSFQLVGGYRDPQIIAVYENHHPDQHAMAFYPGNPNAAISGHDGGLARTSNVLQQPQTWTLINNGFTATQFYAIAVDPQPGNDAVIMGGTQDNGSWVTESTDGVAPWFELLGGDGAFTAIAPGGFPFYVSSQNGFIVRGSLQNGQLFFTAVAPANAQNFLFIAPFLLDPNDARIMYLAAGNTVWRNNNLDGVPVGGGESTTINWTALSNSAVANTAVTALTVTTVPPNRLYFGANNNAMTVLRRVDNAQNNPGGSTITPPGIIAGSNTSSIATNPENGDELLVTYSNFNVSSLWHSTDGGQSWTDVEGNLAGEDGPSLRWAAITPSGAYFIATSVGVFSSTSLNGANTTWVQEGAEVIGNVVVDMLALRPEDGFLVAGTHGRGVYSAKVGTGGSAIATTDRSELRIDVEPGLASNTNFTLRNDGSANLSFNINATGDFQGNAADSDGRFIVTLGEATAAGSGPHFPPSRLSQSPAAHATAAVSHKQHSYTNSGVQDLIILDDGNNTADDFIGFNDGVTDFFWLNKIDISTDYRLEGFLFYMRTESAFSNQTFVAVRDVDGRSLAEGNIEFALAPGGDWFQVNLNTPITFAAGSRFEVMVGASRTIGFPAGADVDGRIRRRSFFFDPGQDDFVNLDTISGFENGAFLIRPFGMELQAQNQNPIARASVNPAQADVGQGINFDASASSDPDGTIAGVFWNFGDGASSTNTVETHSYATPGTFTYTLTVTDNQGATDDLSGQVVISEQSRLTVQPSSGTIAAGSSQQITVAFDSQGLPSGVYDGHVRVTGNGGTVILPLVLAVGSPVSVDEPQQLPRQFTLQQNYPNPFNPETIIRYSLPELSSVRIAIYNTLGQQVRLLRQTREPAGEYLVNWDGRNEAGERMPSGIYVYQIQAGTFTQARKMTLLQ